MFNFGSMKSSQAKSLYEAVNDYYDFCRKNKYSQLSERVYLDPLSSVQGTINEEVEQLQFDYWPERNIENEAKGNASLSIHMTPNDKEEGNSSFQDERDCEFYESKESSVSSLLKYPFSQDS